MGAASPMRFVAAEKLASGLPPLLLQAEKIATLVGQGVHSRRRSGLGDDFWQFRPYGVGDQAHRIDWRQSARTDRLLVRDREFAVPQSVRIWVDHSASMDYASGKAMQTKLAVGQVLGLAISLLALHGGEQVFWDNGRGYGHRLWGQGGLRQLAELAQFQEAGGVQRLPLPAERLTHSSTVLVSDFLFKNSELSDFFKLLSQKESGVLLHVADPLEEAFAQSGRLEVEGAEGEEALILADARAVQSAYRHKWEAHCAELADLAHHYGWLYVRCNTVTAHFDKVLQQIYAHLAG